MVVSGYRTFTNSYRDELWEKHNSFAKMYNLYTDTFISDLLERMLNMIK